MCEKERNNVEGDDRDRKFLDAREKELRVTSDHSVLRWDQRVLLKIESDIKMRNYIKFY